LISINSTGTESVQELILFDFQQELDRTMRSGQDAVSAVKMPQELTAQVDAWAEEHGTVRSDAICRLVELGLNSVPATVSDHSSNDSLRRDPIAIEHQAAEQIGKLLDPALPASERERRTRRLTEGPPEFTDQRIDLPKHGQ
jgi:hypothetical protein